MVFFFKFISFIAFNVDYKLIITVENVLHLFNTAALKNVLNLFISLLLIMY